ncbi:MarR family winged helix-turn-helix transcriptional regulator [Chitinophaga sp. HK235]|uniref:MarR family winged helix-turn-helix transcriptional regulator n=1 Tax=Chitinophaga sp. HK235 TaxID=2952571 RepID=UPI001BA99BEB|nr:helix-turn-helix domain-containing protein [Chitinophaga sp. HK235]
MENLKPIGWYLKEADSLITATFNSTFESMDLTRFHWQVLKNISTHGSISLNEYYPQVARFITPETLQEIVDMLTTRGWITFQDNICRFTHTGAEAFADMAARQQKVQEKMLEGTRPEDYTHTILFLDKIIQNLKAGL